MAEDVQHDSALTPQKISLLEAIQQAMEANVEVERAKERVREIESQRRRCRGKDLLDSMDQEILAAQKTYNAVFTQFQAMIGVIADCKIVVNGVGLPPGDALQYFVVMKKQAVEVKKLAKGVNLHHFDVPRLVEARQEIIESLDKAADAWEREVFLWALLMHGIAIPSSKEEVFECIWMQKFRVVQVGMKWDVGRQAWEFTKGVEANHPDVLRFMNEANTRMKNSSLRTMPLQAQLTVEQGPRGPIFKMRTYEQPDPTVKVVTSNNSSTSGG